MPRIPNISDKSKTIHLHLNPTQQEILLQSLCQLYDKISGKSGLVIPAVIVDNLIKGIEHQLGDVQQH